MELSTEALHHGTSPTFTQIQTIFLTIFFKICDRNLALG
jgi:hypothetical protein